MIQRPSRTKSLVLGQFTALYRSFLQRCTLNKAVGTIWRTLYKPPKRRQGPDPRPHWLLIGTPLAFGPELAYRLHVAHPTLMDVTRYFWYTFILLYMFVYHIFKDPSTLVGCWSSVYKRRIIYTFQMCVLLITRLLRLVGRLRTRTRKPV